MQDKFAEDGSVQLQVKGRGGHQAADEDKGGGIFISVPSLVLSVSSHLAPLPQNFLKKSVAERLVRRLVQDDRRDGLGGGQRPKEGLEGYRAGATDGWTPVGGWGLGEPQVV